MQRGRATKGIICGLALLFLGVSLLVGISSIGRANAPLVRNETPADAASYVSVYLPELSFTVSDSEGDTLHYTVATTPNFIGGQHQGTAAAGTTVHLLRRNGMLSNDTTYRWWVNVSDGTAWTNNTYSFTTVSDVFQGYTLFTPMDVYNDSTYLIDQKGQIVHTWSTSYPPSRCVYLVDNGSILRPCTLLQGEPPAYTRKIQKFAWDGAILWDFQYSGENYYQTHDLKQLPNGNVLLLAYERKQADEAIAAGRDPALLWDNDIWSVYLVEVKPTGLTTGDIVWEWHLWDHLIQDLNASQGNYGVVEDHPELLDINFAADGSDDWIHPNTVSYNPGLDQVIICSRYLSEFWIIDHNTTTVEAAGHTGGRHGRGGDFLYRWGNPKSYRAGNESDQKLFGPHDPQWIEPGCPGEGNILVFNNGFRRPGRPYSTIDELKPPMNASGNYTLVPGKAYGPEKLAWQYKAADPYSFSASHISGCQRLPNGNTLICNGPNGSFFEVTKGGKTVWTYNNTDPVPGSRVFRVRRYYSPFCPPEAPLISGLRNGPRGIQYIYTLKTTDPDGDGVSYGLDWGDNSSLEWFGPFQSGQEIQVHHTWIAEKNYTVRCQAKDRYGSLSPWSSWTTNVGSPYQPSNPSPPDGATNVDTTATFSWTGGDPDQRDIVTYDVYFGTTDPPPKVITNKTTTTYDPGVMEYSRTYHWKIVSWDNLGTSTEGDVWNLSTAVDVDPPATTIDTQGSIGDLGWYVSPVFVSFHATDSQSGVRCTLYALDDGPWTTYLAPCIVTSDDIHTIAYYSIDNVGNEEIMNTAVLKIDQRPPATSHIFSGGQGNNGWYLSVTFILTASDNTSGVNRTLYELDGGSWTVYTAPVVMTMDGSHDLFYYSVDNAGNIEPVKGPFAFKMDSTPPSIVLTVTSVNPFETKWVLNATVSDAPSGIDKVEFYVDNQSQGTVYAPPYVWVYEGSGKVAYAVAYDKAGNSKASALVTCQSLGLHPSSMLLCFNQYPRHAAMQHLT
jgi:hypothetical protein